MASRHGPVKLRLDGLSNLETLEGFDTYVFDVRSFSTLTNLRKLGIDVRDAVKDLAVIHASPSLSHSNRLLRYSSFVIWGSFQIREEQSILRQVLGYRHLHKLELNGSLTELPLPDAFPPNLTHLRFTVVYSWTKGRPNANIGEIAQLKETQCARGGLEEDALFCWWFSSTHRLKVGVPQKVLWEIDDVEEWRVERGAMPSLLDLTIRGCKKLKEVPDGLRFGTTLRTLQITRASQELKDRLREGGEDFSKFQHVHSIMFDD